MQTTNQEEQVPLDTTEQQTTTRSMRLLTVVAAVAYLAGYLTVLFLKRPDIVRWKAAGSQFGEEPLSLFRSAEGATPDAPEMAGWLFYAAHNTGIEIAVESSSPVSPEPALVSLQGTVLWDAYLLLIPVSLLFVAGMLLGWFRAEDSKRGNAKAGVRVAVGYLQFVVVGALMTTWSYTITQPVVTVFKFRTPVALSAFIAGLAYPPVWGGAGGVVGGLLREKVQEANCRG